MTTERVSEIHKEALRYFLRHEPGFMDRTPRGINLAGKSEEFAEEFRGKLDQAGLDSLILYPKADLSPCRVWCLGRFWDAETPNGVPDTEALTEWARRDTSWRRAVERGEVA